MQTGRDLYPQYKKAIEDYLNGHTAKINKFLMLKDTPLIQKQLIKSRLLHRKNRCFEAQKILIDMREQNNYFYEAERNFILSVIADKLSNFQDLLFYSYQAHKYYLLTQDKVGVFKSLHNISIAYSRLSLHQLSSRYLEMAKENIFGPECLVLILRSEVSNLWKQNKRERAVQLLDSELPKYRNCSFDNEILILKTLAADIYICVERFELAHELYAEILLNRNFKNRLRVLFEFKLLKYLLSDEQIQLETDLFESDNEYRFKYQVLKHLINGDLYLAHEVWSKLRLLNPKTYGENFQFLDNCYLGNLYVRVIDKIKKQKSVNLFYNLSGKVGELYKMLANAEFPLKKEIIIEKIWNTSYDPALDSRFYKLVERLKKNISEDVVVENFAYRLSGERHAN